MRRLPTVIVAAVLVLSACAEEEPLRGIDLPPASVPEQVELGGWAVSFSREFDPGFWTEGEHIYVLALVCEPLGDPLSTQPVFLESSSAQQIFPQTIFVRLVGLSHGTLGPKTLNAINPLQPTKAVLTSIGADAHSAREAVETCQGAILIDGNDPLPLTPEEPFMP